MILLLDAQLSIGEYYQVQRVLTDAIWKANVF